MDVDTTVVLEMFKRILVGMSKSEFDKGTDIVQHFDIKNIVTSFNLMYTTMSFDCTYGHVEIQHSTMSTMKIELVSTPVQEQLSKHERQLFNCQISNERNDCDYMAIMNIVKTMGQQNSEQFRLNNQPADDMPVTVVYIAFDNCLAAHKELADLLINTIGKQLGFITSNEADFLCELLALGNETLHREKVSQLFAFQFDTFFETLQQYNHKPDNKFDFNDMDNFIHYIVSKDEVIHGIVSQSQNHMFLFAKNTDTGVIKIWNTMKLTDPEKREMFYEVKDSIFDGAQYMCSMLFSKWSQKYYYPCEFEAKHYLKTPETLIEGFDLEDFDLQLVYSSDTGFYPKHSRKFDPCISDLDFAFEILTSKYEIPDTIINHGYIDLGI